MSNGIVTTSSRLWSALLVASLAASAGCDNLASRPLSRHTAGASLLDPSDDGRQRNDPARERVWIVNSQGVFLYHTGSGKLEEIALPSWQWVTGQFACPPDLALGPDGEAVITSNIVPVLWRVNPQTLAVTVHPLALDADHIKDVGFSGLVYSEEHGAYFAISDVHGSLWRIDQLLTKGQKVPSSVPVSKNCGVTAAMHLVGSTQIPGASKALRPSSASLERN